MGNITFSMTKLLPLLLGLKWKFNPWSAPRPLPSSTTCIKVNYDSMIDRFHVVERHFISTWFIEVVEAIVKVFVELLKVVISSH